jgi:hypothetical protein
MAVGLIVGSFLFLLLLSAATGYLWWRKVRSR